MMATRNHVICAALVMLAALPASAQTPTSAVSAVVGPYLRIQTALAADSVEGVAAAAEAVGKAAEALGAQAADVRTAAADLARATNLAEARAAFFGLSTALIAYAEATKTPMGVRKAYCPMEKKHWAQQGDRIANPYAGSKMLRCGEFQGEL